MTPHATPFPIMQISSASRTARPESEAATSPSLLPRAKGAAAFELKFLLRPDQARAVCDWATRHLTLDRHGAPALDGDYVVSSVYFDTPAWDVFHRTSGFRRRKYRVRGYGVGGQYTCGQYTCGVGGESVPQPVYLERKSKSRGRVSKRRTAVDPAELVRLRDEDPDPSWSGCWFQRRLLARQLRPSCLIRYRRTALVGSNDHGPLRLTLDRQIRCAPCHDMVFASAETWPAAAPLVSILSESVVLELKFCRVLPAQIKGLMYDLRLNPAAVSKYRAAVAACGLAATRREVGSWSIG